MIPYGGRPPHPIYMRAHDRLRVTQSLKTQIFYFLSPNPNSSFPNSNFLSPFIPTALGGGSSWPADARSTHDASSLMGSLPGRRFLVQVQRLHTGLAGWSSSDQKLLHEVMFVCNGMFWCQQGRWNTRCGGMRK
jgi:hypothetical protein